MHQLNRGSLASPHVDATRAGQDVLDSGGSAVDAVISASAVLSVVYPHMVSVGGDSWTLVATPDGGATVYNGSGAAARAVDRPALAAEHGSRMPLYGPHPVTVPGAVSAWGEMHRDHGALRWDGLLEPAIGLAADGMVVSSALGRDLAGLWHRLRSDEGMRMVFGGPDGGHQPVGALVRQPQLAETLRAVRDGGAEAFYRGTVADAFTAGLNRLGSPLSAADLVAHETLRLEPLSGSFRGVEVLTSPPGSSGLVLLQVLALIERLDITSFHEGSGAGLAARAFRLASADRDAYLCDPRVHEVDLEGLLSDSHLDELAERARRESPLPAGTRPRPTGDTVAVVAIDSQGTAVTHIQSVYFAFGSGLLEPATGIVCQNRGSAFVLDPAHPAYLAPGARPPHTLMPVLVRQDGRVTAAVGTMGGRSQPQIQAQLLSRYLDGWHPADTVAAPRWVVGPFGDQDQEVTLAESTVSESVRADLARAGLPLVVGAAQDDRAGHSHIVQVSGDGLLTGTDPRADGAPEQMARTSS